jgi:hypothetical protein
VSQRLFGVVTRFKTSRIKPLTSDDATLPGPWVSFELEKTLVGFQILPPSEGPIVTEP